MVVFGSTRTHHRMWVAIEDAGFEVRDMLTWMYGQGMPKSYNVGQAVEKLLTTGAARRADRDLGIGRRYVGQHAELNKTGGPVQLTTDDAQQWEGWGTGLKPGCEPILLARKPLTEKNVAVNVLKFGTGAININATRISTEGETVHTPKSDPSKREGVVGSDLGFSKGTNEKMAAAQKASVERTNTLGRWPANILLQCTCDNPQPLPERVKSRAKEPAKDRRYANKGATNITGNPGATRRDGGGFAHGPDCPAGILDAQSGKKRSGRSKQEHAAYEGESVTGLIRGRSSPENQYDDFGGASRFFATMRYSDQELLLGYAKAIMEAWNNELVNTADSRSHLPSEVVASALNDAVILASRGEIRLSDCQVLSTSVTPSELRQLCENTIALTLSIELKFLPASFHIDTGPLKVSRAKSVARKKQTDTTMITPSPTSSDGCAAVVTLTTTKNGSEAGAAASATRFKYCPKATKSERGADNKHPTVKPIALMRWLVRLVTPPEGIVVDPFCGSGSTLIAAVEEGFGFVGIDSDPDYCAIAQSRVQLAEETKRG